MLPFARARSRRGGPPRSCYCQGDLLSTRGSKHAPACGCAATLRHTCVVWCCGGCAWCYRLAGRPDHKDCASANYQPVSKPSLKPRDCCGTLCSSSSTSVRAHALPSQFDCVVLGSGTALRNLGTTRTCPIVPRPYMLQRPACWEVTIPFPVSFPSLACRLPHPHPQV